MTAPGRRQSRAVNVLLAGAVSVAFLGLLEGASRLVEAYHPPAAVADYIWDWEAKWDGEFYTIGSEGVGWPPWEEINGDGLRDRTHAVEKPDGVRRLVFLGDSVTLGAGIEPKQAYPQVLQARLDDEGRPVEVFNAALWGWSTRQQRIAYQRIVRRYAPDEVVLAVCLNDIPEVQNNLTRLPRLLGALHRRSALVRRIVDAPGREIQSVEQLFGQADSPKVRQGYERFFAEVRALRDEVRRDDAGFRLVVFPFRFQVAPGAPPPAAQDRIAAFCAAEGLSCLDLLPALRAVGEAAFLDYDHLSPAGASAVAGELLAVVPSVPSHRDVLERSGAPRTAAELVRLLAGGEPAGRAAAAWALGRQADARAVEPLRRALVLDASERVRAAAAAALGALGGPARGAAAALFTALDDPREAVRWNAARALAALGLDALDDVARLAAALRNRDAYVRSFAAWSLGNLGPAARDAVPALVGALREEDGYGRGGAAAALAKIGPAAEGAVPALLEGLRGPDGDRRWKAARTLGRIGPAAAVAVPALIQALGDPNEHVRAHAARALGRIAPADRRVAEALARSAGDPEETVRREAAEALEASRRD